MHRVIKPVLLGLTLASASLPATAADYVIDGTGAGMHSFVQFKAKHVGISNLWGRFNDITGTFSYDADNIEASSLSVSVNTTSLDTNHEARDTHLKSGDYIDADKFPLATFESTGFTSTGDNTVEVTGNLTLREITKEITIEAHRTGEGDTFFGDYRVGFEGSATINVKDFGVNLDPDPQVELILSIEGIRQ